MATYYYYEDAVGTADGLSEANAYDGSTSTTLPDGSTDTCTFRLVISALQSGDTLYIKKSSSPISFGSSLTPQTETTNAADHNDVDGYGYISLIGYETTPGDDGRAEIDMGGSTLRYRPYVRYENLNITGSYGGEIFMLGNASVMRKCRIHKTGSYGACVLAGSSSLLERCEFINDYSTASPTTSDSVVQLNPGNVGTVRSCYLEGGNGVHGIVNKSSTLGCSVIENNIIVLNLDKDATGNSDGSGVYFQDLTYERGSVVNGNIIYNANNALLLGVNDTRFGGMIFSYNIIANCQKAVDGTSTYPDFYFWPGYSGDTSTHSSSAILVRASNNFFYANTSNGDLPSQESATYLTTDPFVDAANKDFTLKNPDDFGYAKSFLQAGASGDTITRNALVNIAPFTTTDSGSLSLSEGNIGDIITVSGRSFQKIDDSPIVWRRTTV